MFANPEAAFNNIRQPILGYDTHDGGFGVYRGLPYWNVDLSIKKMFKDHRAVQRPVPVRVHQRIQPRSVWRSRR